MSTVFFWFSPGRTAGCCRIYNLILRFKVSTIISFSGWFCLLFCREKLLPELFTHVCPVTGFCRCFAFQIGKICCQNCIVRNFQFRKFLPVNSYDRSSLPVPLPSSDGRHYMWFPASKSTSFLHFCDKSRSHLTFP